MDEQPRREDWYDAGESAYLAFENLSAAQTLPEQATAWDALTNAMADLVSFLPGWDVDRGVLVVEGDEP